MRIKGNREKELKEHLRLAGVLDNEGNYLSFVDFERNPALDRVWIPNLNRKQSGGGGTCISADCLIADSMIEILGSRVAYIHWVRQVAAYIVEKTGIDGLEGSAGLSRLVQREAVAFIKKYSTTSLNGRIQKEKEQSYV